MPIGSAGKEYIAKNLGAGDCFVKPGLTWTAVAWDGATADESGGTADIVGRLVTTSVYKEIRLKTPRVGTYTYAALKAANGGVDITLPEAKAVIADHDGYPSGQDQYCYVAGAPPPVNGEKGWVALCSLPAGADIYIDGTKVPWVAPLCPSPRNYEVTARATHTVKYVLSGYKDKEITFSIGVGGTWQAFAVLEAVAGPNTGTLKLTAHEWVKDEPHIGQELYARPSIAGTTMEEKLLTPLTINLSIPAGATSKEYKVGAIHPGYEKAEKTVTLRKTHTPASPLVVDLLMKEVRIWREVRVVEKMPRVAWVTGISIPAIMAWNVSYTGWVKFVFTLATRYRAHLDLHIRPSGWDGRIESLDLDHPTARISTVEETLTPWPENEISLKWAWTCLDTIPEGTYVVVSVIEYVE